MLDYLFYLVCFSPSLIFIGVILVIARIAKKGKLSYIWMLLPVSLTFIFIMILSLAAIYDYSGLLWFGIITSLLAASVISLVVAYYQDRKKVAEFGRKMISLYLIGSFLTVTSSVSSTAGSFITIGWCESYHIKVGNIIVASLENYFRDHNSYPNSLSELFPQYIKKESITTCYSLNSISPPEFGGFYYKNCSSNLIELSIPRMVSGHFNVYDLINKKWYSSNNDWLSEQAIVTRCP